MSKHEALPGLRRVDHVSLTVADLDAAIAFYCDAFGAELAYRMGPFDARELPRTADDRDWTEAHVNVGDARLRIAMLRLAANLGMELFEYERPQDARRAPPRNCDVGARHLCLEVGNIEAAIAHLESKGCRALAGPILMQGGPCPDSKSWYVLDPFGHQLELVEYF